MKNLFVIICIFFTTLAFAQKDNRVLTLNKETNLIDVVYYYDNGNVSQTGHYTADGKLDGKWMTFDEAGNKTVVAYYEAGKKVGKWTYWIDGKTKEVDYTNNVASL